jgi:hypothetical protein
MQTCSGLQTCDGKEHGGGEEGRRVLVEEQNDVVLWGFVFLIFNFNKGNFVTLYTQNDVVLGFSSILTVDSLRASYFIPIEILEDHFTNEW